jgi:DNA-binding NarL/FixJ family response regulator
MRVIIVDDHALIRTGMTNILHQHFDAASIAEAATGAEALELLEQSPADLVIVDLFIPGEDSFGFIRQLCDQYPALLVVVVSASENPSHIRKAIDTGASGFIPKSFCSTRFLNALDMVLDGGIFMPDSLLQANPAALAANGETTPGTTRQQLLACLTPRQHEILQMVGQGHSNKQIARQCQLSENTVKVHVSAILRALGLNNRTQAGVLMQQLKDFPTAG